MMMMQFNRRCFIWLCFNGNGFYQQSCDYAVSTFNDSSYSTGTVIQLVEISLILLYLISRIVIIPQNADCEFGPFRFVLAIGHFFAYTLWQTNGIHKS